LRVSKGFSSARIHLGVIRRSLLIRARRRRVGVHAWLRENPYHEMICSRFSGATAPEPLSTLDDLEAFVRLPSERRVLWIHSEASYSWGDAEENLLQDRFEKYIGSLKTWSNKGGRFMWTLHDIGLHLADHDQSRIGRIRELLAKTADCVHVHSTVAAEMVSKEFGIAESRIVVVPHPTYAPVYDGISVSRTESENADRRALLFFGFIKSYKNLDGLIDALLALPKGSFERLTIAGRKQAEIHLKEADLSKKLNCDFRLRFIPHQEVPGLFCNSHFTVLPYTSSLTSGAAALSMGFGVPVIAPDIGGMRETLPEENHHLLYDPSHVVGLRLALERARDMPTNQYGELRSACRAKGESLHPSRISSELLDHLRSHYFSAQ
jgi:glycosyltransferase involved in cell wall biosynthesis